VKSLLRCFAARNDSKYGREDAMDLTLSDKHRALQEAVRAFIRDHGYASPKLGGGRKRPDQKALDWQKLLVDHGYVARTIPREYGGFGAEPDVMEAAVIAAELAPMNRRSSG